MADNFSVVLDDSANIINAPVYNPGPNPLNSVLSTVSQGLQQFARDNEERTRQKSAREKEAREQREADLRGYLFDSGLKLNAEARENNALDPFLGLVQGSSGAALALPSAPSESDSLDPATAIIEGAVQSGAVPAPRMGELSEIVQGQAEEVANIDTAISQGSMPKSARDAAVDRMLLETRSLFPDVDAEVIVSMMEKMGLKTTMFYDIQRTFKDREAIDDARAKSMSEAYTRGMDILGPSAAGMAQEQIIATGMIDVQREREMENIRTSLEIEKARSDLTDAEIQRMDRQAARQMQTITIQSAMDTFSPLINSAQQLIDIMGQNPGSNPAAEEQFMEVMGQLKMRLPVLIENYASQVATTTGDLAKADEIRDYLTKSLTNLILTPLENRDSDFRQLAQRLETNLGLKVSQAYPFIGLLKGMGVDLQLTDTLLEQLDPSTRERLADEIANVMTTDIYDLRQRESAQMQVMEIVEVLSGNTTLSALRLDRDQLRQRFSTINRTTQALGRQIVAGNYNNEQAWLNGMAETAVAAQQLDRTSSTVALGNAITSLTDVSRHAFDRLINGASSDPERAQAVGLGVRAAVARAMEGLKSKSRDFGNGYSVKYRNGKWEVVFDINSVPGGNRQGVQNQIRLGRLQPPSEANLLATSLNNASNFLVNTAQWDEGAPKASAAELRDWYNSDLNDRKVPASMQKQLDQQRQQAQSAPSVMEALNSFEELLQTGDFRLQVPTRTGGGGLEVDAEGNAVLGEGAQAMAAAARSTGFSPAVVAGILANIQHESSFDPTAVGDDGTAFGYFQHRKERVENFVRVTGVRPENATPQQAIQFFKWELDNPEQAGMTKAQAQAILNAATPAEAAMLIQRHYERPKNVDPARAQTALAFHGALFGGR